MKCEERQAASGYQTGDRRMARLIAVSFLLTCAAIASAQPKKQPFDPKEPPIRFGLRQSPELYPQDTPKNALYSVLRAMDKDRYDYLLAHLLEPGYVTEQLAISYPVFEKRSRSQVEDEQLARKGFDREFIVNRIRDQATQANFENLVQRIRAKLDNDPESGRDLRKMYKEGSFEDGGATSVAKLKDVKDRALYFKRVGDRWYIENKVQD
jgi:hypothetical protein